jgi:hypothetical protein
MLMVVVMVMVKMVVVMMVVMVSHTYKALTILQVHLCTLTQQAVQE